MCDADHRRDVTVMMSSRKEKIVTAGCAIVILIVAAILISVGSFIPKWASVKNKTADGNVSYSLWTREECFGIICVTEHVKVQWTNEDCWPDSITKKQVCRKTSGYKIRSDTTCRVANYCNSTWIGDGGERVCGAVLSYKCCAVLYCVVLYCVVLYCAVYCAVYCVVLCCVVLCCAVLCCAEKKN